MKSHTQVIIHDHDFMSIASIVTSDFPGCYDIVSWCLNPDDVPTPPGVQGFDDNLLICSYSGPVFPTRDECRLLVIPEYGSELLLDFTCPSESILKWRAGAFLNNNIEKQLKCNIEEGLAWLDVNLATKNQWPICGMVLS